LLDRAAKIAQCGDPRHPARMSHGGVRSVPPPETARAAHKRRSTPRSGFPSPQARRRNGPTHRTQDTTVTLWPESDPTSAAPPASLHRSCR
jgi:hypothetical protein